MGAAESNVEQQEREREFARAVAEQENRRLAYELNLERLERQRLENERLGRERLLKLERIERARLERDRNIRANQELESLENEQFQEALRRSMTDYHGRVDSSVNNSRVTGNERYQTTPSAPNLPNHDQARKDDSTLCKTCKKPYGEKIFQCKNGHSSCEPCWSLDLPCGLCRGPITNIRNLDLEAYFATNQPVKCPNAAEGCILSFKKTELLRHEKICPFREMKCPALIDCKWKGKISQLSIHFDEKHPSSRQTNVGTEMFLPNFCNEYNSLQLIKLGTYNFLFFIKVSESERRIYMDIQLIGTKTTASKWKYEIHVYNTKEPRRKYVYSNCCRSSQVPPDGFALHNCAILPLSYAMSFNNEGTLSYKLYIRKTVNEKRN